MNNDAKFPGCLIVPPDSSIQVKGFLTGPEGAYEQGRGYVNEKDNTVYVFSSHGKPMKIGLRPYFWIEDGEIVLCKTAPQIQKYYNADLIDWCSLEEIMSNSSKEDVMMTPEQIADINMSSNRMLPQINEEDDFLKKAVKKAMWCKNIILAKLKSATNEQWVFNNLKTALFKETKLTPPNFCKWAELLGFDFTVKLYDSGYDSIDPLTSVVIYRSKENKVYSQEDYYMNDAEFTKEQKHTAKFNIGRAIELIEETISSIDDKDHAIHPLNLELKDISIQLNEMVNSLDGGDN